MTEDENWEKIKKAINYDKIKPAELPTEKEILQMELSKMVSNPFKGQIRGKRLMSNQVKVRVSRNGQVSVTIPRGVANATGLKRGSILRFEIQAYGGIKLLWKNPQDKDFSEGR